MLHVTAIYSPKRNAPSSNLLISAEIIRPIPSIHKKPGKANSRQTQPVVLQCKDTCGILTASPYQHELELAVEKRNNCLTKKKKAKMVTKAKGKVMKKSK